MPRDWSPYGRNAAYLLAVRYRDRKLVPNWRLVVPMMSRDKLARLIKPNRHNL
jgi:hypothetical protein